MSPAYRYRLYTECLQAEFITALASLILGAATIYSAGINGIWQGIAESSLIVEFTGNKDDQFRVERLAKWIKVANHQEAILITREKIESILA